MILPAAILKRHDDLKKKRPCVPTDKHVHDLILVINEETIS